MPHLVAAPDKFRGTATAAEVARAAGGAARRAGWTADEIPMSDGGEGLLEAIGGTPHYTTVPGPLGDATEAEWRLLPAGPTGGPTAVIEMSRAAGRLLLPAPRRDDPVAADTSGVGHLILRARDADGRNVFSNADGSESWKPIVKSGIDHAKKIGAYRFGYRTVLFSPEKVREALARFEVKAVS